MKHLYARFLNSLFFAGLLFPACAANAQQIEGSVLNPVGEQFIHFAYSKGLATIQDSVRLTKQLTFSKRLKLQHAAYVQLSYNRHRKNLYIFPDGKFKILFDGSTDSLFRVSFQITGDYQINRYLDFVSSNQLHYRYISDHVNLKQPIDSFATVLANFRSYSDSVRTAFFRGSHQNLRKRPVQDFILTDSLNWYSYSVLSAIDYSRLNPAGNQDKFWQQEVVNRIKPLASPQALTSERYPVMWSFYLRRMYARAAGLRPQDDPVESRGFPGFVFGYIQSKSLPYKLRELIASRLLDEITSMYSYRSLEQNRFYDSVITVIKGTIQDTGFLTWYDRFYASQQHILQSSLPGKKAPDFSLLDTAGKVYTLADFKGKVVLIDVWATWCKPCLDELPYLKELEQRLKDQNFELLSVSADDSRQIWMRDGIYRLSLSGVRLWEGTDKKFSKLYNIYALPVLILLDQNGNFIQYNPPRASEGEKLYQLIANHLSNR